jgi:hypothetical protein
MYVEAVKDFPSTETKLYTQKGRAFHIKTDVFKGELWYLHENNDRESGGSTMVVLSPDRVKEIIAMNKAGEKPADLKDFETEKVQSPKEVDYSNVVGQDSLNRFDDNFKRKKNKKKKGNPNATVDTRANDNNPNRQNIKSHQNPVQSTEGDGEQTTINQGNKQRPNPNKKGQGQNPESSAEHAKSSATHNLQKDKSQNPNNQRTSENVQEQKKPNQKKPHRTESNANASNAVRKEPNSNEPDSSLSTGTNSNSNARPNRNRNKNRNKNKPNQSNGSNAAE